MALSIDDPLYQLIDAEQRRREQSDLMNVSNPNIPSDLGTYRGLPVQSSDPNFRQRQEALTALRENELARMQGMANATRADSLNAIQQAGLLASTGGVQKNALPDSSPYVNVYDKDYTRNLGLTNTRLKGAEDDEGRVSSYIRNAYGDTKDIEQTDYQRRQKEIENRRAEEQLGISKERFAIEKEKANREMNNPELVGVTQDGNKTIWRNPKTGEYMTGDGKVANAEDLLAMRGVGSKKDEFTGDIIYDESGRAYERVFNKSTGTSQVRPLGGTSTSTGVPSGAKLMDKATLKEKEKEAKLTDKQIEDVTDLDQTLRALDEIEKAKKGIDTGPLAGRFNAYGQQYGFGDYIPGQKATTDLASRVGAAHSAYQKALSGLSVGEKEAQRLMLQMPQMNDNDEAFDAKLKAMRDIVKQQKETKLENLSKQGKNVKPYQGVTGNTTTGQVNAPGQRTVVKTGTYNGRPVVQYSDGSVEYK